MMDRDRLLAMFDVDLEAGRLFWRVPPRCHAELRGKEAGCSRRSTNGKLYWHVKIDRRPIKRANLIFLAVHGRFPVPLADHRDGDSLNDRPINLREATVLENARNHKHRARRAALPMGVRVIGSGRFQARIGLNGKQLHLGAYDTPQEAEAVYRAKRQELFGEFA